ncbi:MFS transporter [Streptomyces sp. AC512_CC834]|uniref:MFS transporter n=1 Tax=Streptomyces sp. AC512_CC834 TaxID=2823691 RepID=UPI0027E593B8|nr:MFS transporter [Streptomyces sp. AC512_CC834]
MPKGYSIRSYLAGAVAARSGDEMSGPALLLAGLALTGSTTDASSLLAGITISAAIGGPVLGALLDRAARPGRLLAGALALYAAGLGAILVALGRLPVACTVLLAALTGLLGPALSGGWTAQLPRVATDGHLPRANALDAMTFSAASLAGPALAGVVAQTLGASTAVVVSAALVATAVPAAWRLPSRSGAARDARPTPAAGALGAGFRVIRRRPLLARATLTSVVSCAAQGMLAACVPLLGARVLGAAGRGALLFSCAAASALAANAVLARRPRSVTPDTIVRAGALVQAAALALAATARPATLVVAALVLGIGEGPQLTALFAVRHREAPDHLRGRIFTTGASLKITAFALGVAVGGPLATWSLPGALTMAAGTAAGAAFVGPLSFRTLAG